MIRIAGVLLLTGTAVLTGCTAASMLKARRDSLREVIRLISCICLMIRYEALETEEIIRRLDEYYSDSSERNGVTRFIAVLSESLTDCFERGESLRSAWTAALSCADGAFSADDKALMERIGSVIGSCDVEGQLTALELCSRETEELLRSAETDYVEKGRLYRSLGAAAGALIAVICI